MEKVVIVIDTNTWSNIMYVFDLIKQKLNLDNERQVWATLDASLIESYFTANEKKLYKGPITIIKAIVDMKKHPDSSKFEIHVPSFVYNEVAFSISSKITNLSEKNRDFQSRFDNFLSQLPIETVVDKTELVQGTDYPNKNADPIDIESEMETFLQGRKHNRNLDELLNHLSQADKNMRATVQKRTNTLKKLFTDIRDKTMSWDKPISNKLKAEQISYSTKAGEINSLFGKISEYADAGKIGSDARKVVAKRLTMQKENFDFFDLLINLYAKEKKAYIFSMDKNLFQEINDPHFLGYFQELKVMHPLINFESLESFKNTYDLIEMIKSSIEDDFKKDITILSKFDEKLDEPRFHEPVKRTIEKILLDYSTTNDKLKNIIENQPLSSAVEMLQIENKKLKLSKKLVFSESKAIKNKLSALMFVDKQFFTNHLSFSNFIIDVDLLDPVKFPKINRKSIQLKLRDFLKQDDKNLQEFLMIYKNKDPAVEEYFQSLYIESHFKKEHIDQLLTAAPDNPRMPVTQCPEGPGKSMRKREVQECLLKWEDIEEINEGRLERMNPEMVKIDSEKFLRYVNTVQDPQERIQLIQFADQIINSGGAYEGKISGPKVNEVTHLINQHKVIDHFGKVNHVSSALNYGVLGKNILGELLQGDIKGVAINIGFIAGSSGLAKVAQLSFARGVKYAESGRLILANSFKAASPFVSRLVSPLIAYDLYNQIKALNDGDNDAIVNIVGDGVFLGIDAFEIGASILETVGVISGVSAVAGPIGMAVGAVVFIGTEIYSAVRQVDKIDNIIHLTTGERWRIGVDAFFNVGLPHYIEDLVEIKSANNKVAKEGMEFLKQQKTIRNYVVPSALRNTASSKVELARDNRFTPGSYPNIKWDRARPDNPAGGRVFCAPQGNWETAPSSVTYMCSNTIGIEDLGLKSKNYTLFNLGDGNDVINGFASTPNIYRVGSGNKEITGGNFDDIFVFERGLKIENFPKGKVNGLAGTNMLDLGNLESYTITVQFEEEPEGSRIKLQRKRAQTYEMEMKFHNINGVLGRANAAEHIFSICSTKYINGRGGSPQVYDVVSIQDYRSLSDTIKRKECSHDKVIQLGPNTLLLNKALVGKFSYFINDVHSNMNCTLLLYTPPLQRIALPSDVENDKAEQNFFLNCSLFDITNIQFLHKKNNYYDLDILFVFTDKHGTSQRLTVNVVLGNEKNNSGRIDTIKFFLKDNTQLRCHNDGLYALLKSDKSVEDIITTYRPLSSKLHMSLFITSESGGTTVSIGSDSRDDILHNDPRHKSYLVGNKGSNVYVVASGRETIYGPKSAKIPDITIYTSGEPKEINTLQLQQLSQQIKKDLGKELLLKHVFDSEKLVIYLYTVQTNKTCGRGSLCNSYNIVTSITFQNTPKISKWDAWCKRLHVILNNAPVVLKCDASYESELMKNRRGEVIDENKDVNNYIPSNYYTPIPLTFTSYDVIAIGEEDVEPHTEVIVGQQLGTYRLLRHDDDLLLTNGFDFDVTSYHPVSIIFKNFYQSSNVFYTLRVKFNDKMVHLKNERQEIKNAMELNDWYNRHNNYINSITKIRSKRGVEETINKQTRLNNDEVPSESDSDQRASPLHGTGVIRTVMDSLLDYCNKPFAIINDYLKSIGTSTPMQSQKQFYLGSEITQKDNIFSNQHRIESKHNIGMNYENISDINSTLLLLDVIVRKMNDSKYKLPTEDYLLSPEEKIENKLSSLTKKLGLDPNDIVGSLEDKHRQFLANMDLDREASENDESAY